MVISDKFKNFVIDFRTIFFGFAVLWIFIGPFVTFFIGNWLWHINYTGFLYNYSFLIVFVLPILISSLLLMKGEKWYKENQQLVSENLGPRTWRTKLAFITIWFVRPILIFLAISFFLYIVFAPFYDFVNSKFGW